MSDLPGDLGGSDPLTPWLNRLKRAIAARTVLNGINYRVRRGVSGVVLDPAGGGGKPGEPGDPGTPTKFILRDVLAQVLRCVLASDPDGPDVYVAKPPKLQNFGISSGDGVGTYEYDLDYCTRLNTRAGAPFSVEVVRPHFLIGDVIWALPISPRSLNGAFGAANTVTVEWLDINDDARAWALVDI